MRHEVLDRIEKVAEEFGAHTEEAESLGRLPDASVALLRDSGVMRLLQPAEYGGYEAHPCEFVEAIMAIASECGASGWVAGVVGVHPWELGMADPTAQAEVWGDDVDTWIASPYAPMGRARPTDGGFIFNGRWPFSSGTDFCRWIFLGGVVTGQDGELDDQSHTRHFLLPRSDYEIIEDSWNVAGLKGTGSKDVVVKDAFVPEYRTVDEARLLSGDLGRECGRSSPLYRLPFMTMFPAGITAAVIGIAEGALAATLAYQRGRITGFANKAAEDPHILAGIGEAASEIDASRVQFLANTAAMYECLSRGEELSLELRAKGRRDQVRAAWRAVAAVDTLFSACGGNALRSSKPIQRYWRDCHAGLQHVIHIKGPVYETYTSVMLGRGDMNSVGGGML